MGLFHVSIFIWTARARPNSLSELAITSLMFYIRSIFFLYSSGTLIFCELISVSLILVGPFSVYLTCFLMVKGDMFPNFSPLGTLFYCSNLPALLGSSLFHSFSSKTQPILLLRTPSITSSVEIPRYRVSSVVQWGLI